MSAPAQAVVATGWAARRPRPTAPAVLVAVVVLVLIGYIGLSLRAADPVTPRTPFPHDAGMERVTGVQFSRVAVIGDGGLVMVEYVVQDAEKATAFRADQAHVPVLTSQSRPVSTNLVSPMRPGHTIQNGQSYFFIYKNTAGALRTGERVTITYRGHELTDVPVL